MIADEGRRDAATLLVVEDHELLAQSLAAVLEAEGFEVVVPGSRSPQAIASVAAALSPDAVLLDLHLDDGASAVPLIEPLRATGAAVVMVTGETDRIWLAECLEAGAAGVVPKSAPFDRLIASLRKVLEGGELIGVSEREQLLADLRSHRSESGARQERFAALTPREQQVLMHLMQGHSAESIAEIEVVALSTVRSHIRSVLSKLGVSSQLAAVAAAREVGWSPNE
jgi:two-component system, NarL family, nitrate/nitrite response regulator NarL